ncbi:hypothetical protein HNY73_009556 [Argiope bruennichi]|uniref:Uncharacterized protein n=1 Tax=Argiope bruennichi TaxID=94029 RepID=A0A8T0FA10_ARGBR|nr:hypothetical protein HNY73_009556 [Argiope bruennichi]
MDHIVDHSSSGKCLDYSSLIPFKFMFYEASRYFDFGYSLRQLQGSKPWTGRIVYRMWRAVLTWTKDSGLSLYFFLKFSLLSPMPEERQSLFLKMVKILGSVPLTDRFALSELCKIVERLFVLKLNYWLDHNKISHTYQHGF